MPMSAVFGIIVAASLTVPAAQTFPSAEQTDLVGAQAPDFSLHSLEGTEISLKSLRGHVVVLHFWATYWQSCYADMGHVDQLYREFKNQGVIVLGVNVGQLPRVVQQFITKKGYKYPQLINARGELILQYQATDAPTVVVIGKDGRIASYRQYEQGEQKLRSTLEAVLH